MSWGLWVPTIWVGIMLSRPLGCWLAGDSGGIALGSPEDGTPIDRNVSLILIFLGFAILAKRGVQWPKFFKENQWLCVFYLFWLLSILWSDYTFIAFKRWFRDAASVVMILVIFTEENPTEALRQVFLRCAYLLIPFSFLTMKFYLDIGRTYNPWTGEAVLCGVTMGKNQLGRLAMVSGLFLIWSLSLQEGPSLFSKIRERWFDAAVLVLCVMLLAQADSKTSLFCFGLGVCVFFAARMDWIKANGTRLVFWGGLLISLSVVFFSVPDLRGIVTGALHRNVNLTERTDVWAGCLGLDTNPLIGMGFASVWLTPAAIALGYKLQVEEAHNGYLETYLNGGLIGLCLLLFVLIVAGRYTVRKVLGDASLGPLYASLFLVGVIYNYTEAAFNNGNAVGFLLWILAIQYQAAKDEVPVEMSGEIDQDQPRSASSFGLLLTKDQHPGEDSGLTQEFTGLIQSISHRR